MNTQHSNSSRRGRAFGRIASTVAIAVCALQAIGLSPALASPGQLDPQFNGGTATFDFGGNDSAQAVLTQPLGRVVAVGGQITGSTSQVALTRYDANGTVDQSFGPVGSPGRSTWAPANVSVSASSAVLDLSGRIVVAGTAYAAGTSQEDFFVARFSANGKLDYNFHNGDGYVITNFGGPNDEARDVVVQPNGKIVVVGTGGSGNNIDVALARYLDNGNPDDLANGFPSSFGSTGRVSANLVNSTEMANAVLVQPNGAIVVAGFTSGSGASSGFVARFLPYGAIDTSFGNGCGCGFVTTYLGSGHNGFHAVALDPNGKIVAGGTGNGRFAVARYQSAGNAGALDASFGILAPFGVVYTEVGGPTVSDTIYGILTYGSSIIAIGTTNPMTGDFAVVRYRLSNGSLDPTFAPSGPGGIVTTNFGSGDTAYAAALSGGNTAVVAAGSSSNNFALARYQL